MKYRTFFRVFSLIISIIMIASVVVGCSQKTDKSTDSTSTITSSDSSSPSTTLDENPDSPSIKNLTEIPDVTIEALILADAEPDLPGQYFGEFMKRYPSIKVDLQLITSGGTIAAIQPRVAANNLPDIFHGGSSEYFIKLAEEGWLMDIGDLECFQNMSESMKAVCTSPSGIRFNIPPADGLVGMFCNMDLFKKAGLEVPKTWDEFIEVCKAFKNKGIVALNLGGGHKSSVAHFLACTGITYNITKNSPEKINEFINYEYDFQSKEFMDFLKKIQLLIDINPFPEGYLGMDYNTANAYFINGNSAMYIQGTWFCADALYNDFECIFTTAPWNNTIEEAGYISIPETGMLFSNKTSRERKIAAKLAAEFIMGDGYYIIQNRRACIPPYPVDKYPKGVKLDERIVSALSEAESKGLTTYTHIFQYLPSVIYSELPALIQEMLSGQSTAEQVAASLIEIQRTEKP
ncbi:MAG TPA: carbohydrate ABC transporter substrate-binding protein [Clostridiaceae bacterium]|nr:carbohydrate ABC transporter substrate-binding protein [Clostridiaceae bacterium]